MTRRTRGELEQAIADLEASESTDADPTRGVTADFVTFAEDGEHTGDAPAEFIAFTEGDNDA